MSGDRSDAGYAAAASRIAADNSKLREIADLAAEQIRLEDEIAALERQLKQRKEDLARVEQDLLPEAMQAAGLKNFTTEADAKVEVRQVVRAAMLRSTDGLAWIRQSGNESLIKRGVTLEFSRGQDNIAGDLIAELRRRYPTIAVTDDAYVHHSTLASWAREQIEAGQAIPLDTLGVHVGRRAKIRRVEQDGRHDEEQ